MNEMFDKEGWMIRKWRPAMGWLYFTICLFDFIIGPVLFTVLQANVETIAQWQPMTMRAGGLFHVAMGAIVGVAAWSRGQEKIKYMDYFDPVEEPTEKKTIKETEDSVEPVKKDSVTK